VDNEHVPNSDGVKPHLEASCFLCLELFFGTGNLTYAMRHFSPDSFCVDHKVTKQLVEIVCLDLSKEDRQILVEQWAPFFFGQTSLGSFWRAKWHGFKGMLQKDQQEYSWSSIT
jgi:hypothetical protein